MTEHRRGTPGAYGARVPRDMPDQQARPGEDPWEAAETGTRRAGRTEGSAGERDASEGGDLPDERDVPDTDEAGTGRRGAPQTRTGHPEHPVPDEPPG
ncbi:hypothetical protein [Streptomyces mexicanus]|uniref:hypothetical protein n=1 Tax=Streptomyces mexicanus TaxID=178566 RepID=UPI001359028D|nr:hypothetical protein [Streptomyces mexicanus]